MSTAVLAERYELGEVLGTGGMARVVAAQDLVLHRQVAIKLIHDRFSHDPTIRERLLREARTTAGLHHQNTVTVFDVGTADGQPFIVMELVRGQTLAQRLTSGPLSVDETIAVVDGALAGLQAAHERGLVHRDIKPSNVLLPTDGGVKLADFGIAKALTEAATGLTGTGQLLGTPRYLAPEQADGQPVSPASDVYSMGVLVYHCLTGDVPFKGATPLTVALAHQDDPVPSVAAAAPNAPGWLCNLVERALAKDPSARFPDAGAMRAAMTARPGSAPTPPPPPDHTRVLASAPAAASSSGARTYRGTHAGRAAGRWRWLVVAVALGAILLVTAAMLLNNRGDTNDEEAARPGLEPTDQPASQSADQPAGDEAAGTPSPARTPAGPEPDTETAPADALDELIAELALDSTGAGEKGEDLFEDLRKLRSRHGHDDGDGHNEQTEKALELVEDVGTWMADGELDATVGAEAIDALERLGRAAVDPELAEVSALFAEVATAMPRWGDEVDDRPLRPARDSHQGRRSVPAASPRADRGTARMARGGRDRRWARESGH